MGTKDDAILAWAVERNLGHLQILVCPFSQLVVGDIFWDTGWEVIKKPELHRYFTDQGVSSTQWKVEVRHPDGELGICYGHPHGSTAIASANARRDL